MITKLELFEKAKLKGIFNKSYSEKDYLLELVLFSLSRNTKQELIFKGGTALSKLFKLDRFSEDLDFSAVEDINVNGLIGKIKNDLSKFNIEAELSKLNEPFNSILINLKIKGPLYNGNPLTISTIRIDINKKSKVELEPLNLRFTSLYLEIPPFYVLVMQEKEILTEKIRAIMTRNKARDLYDAYKLIEKGIEIDKILIDKKMTYYRMRFNKNDLIKSIDEKEKSWSVELKPLLDRLPSFSEVKKSLLSAFN